MSEKRSSLCPANRTETGQFKSGYSGNPSGRPKRSDAEREAISRFSELIPTAIDTLISIIQSPRTPARDKVRCCEIIIERVLGKPMEHNEIDDISVTPGNIAQRLRESRHPIYE